MTRLVCISDTHNQLRSIKIPDGDILVHAGDLTNRGTLKEVAREIQAFASLSHPHKILVAGNHDWLFERDPALCRNLLRDTGITYLEDSGATVAGLQFWGSPVQPWFCDWAFNRARGEAIRNHWDLIPRGVDVLVSHGPPHGQLDLVLDQMEHVGCEELALAVARVRPKLLVFGHIHCGYGEVMADGVHYVNAAICDETYSPIRAPIVVDF